MNLINSILERIPSDYRLVAIPCDFRSKRLDDELRFALVHHEKATFRVSDFPARVHAISISIVLQRGAGVVAAPLCTGIFH